MSNAIQAKRLRAQARNSQEQRDALQHLADYAREEFHKHSPNSVAAETFYHQYERLQAGAEEMNRDVEYRLAMADALEEAATR